MSRRIPESPAGPPRAEDGGASTALGGFVGVLANGAFLRLWMAQAISQTAQQTINFALIVQVRQIIETRGMAGGNTATSLLVLSFATPPILFSAVAGVLVDRSNKRNIMAAVNIGRALCISGYLLLDPRWPVLAVLLTIYTLGFLFSTVGQLFGPAEGSTIPLLVSPHQLISANALFSFTFIGSQLLGFVILGQLLITLLGLRNLYITVILLYLLCTTLVLTLPPTPATRRDNHAGTARSSIWADLREVWRFVRRDPLLSKAITYLTIANSNFLMIAVLAPEFIVDVLKLPSQRLATVVTPAGLGMLCGVIVVGRFGRRADRALLVERALIAVGVLLFGFAVLPTALSATGIGAAATISPAIVTAMALAGGLGIANAFIIVPSHTLMQERSNERIRGRVLSTFFTASNAAALIPILFAGVLGDLFGVVRVLAAIALLALAIGLISEWHRRHRAPAPPRRA